MRLFKGDKHRRWQQDISAYIDGYLEPRKRQALQTHLAECISCQEELEPLRGVVALLRRVPQASVPRSFALSEAPVTRMAWGIRYAAPLRYATATAALLLLAIVVGDLTTGRPSIAAPQPTAATEPREVQAPDETLTGPVLTAPAPATEGTPGPGSMPTPQPMAAAAPDEAEKTVTTPALPAPATEERRTIDTLLRWAEVALGVLLAALAVLVAIQWRLGRRRSGG